MYRMPQGRGLWLLLPSLEWELPQGTVAIFPTPTPGENWQKWMREREVGVQSIFRPHAGQGDLRGVRLLMERRLSTELHEIDTLTETRPDLRVRLDYPNETCSYNWQ